VQVDREPALRHLAALERATSRLITVARESERQTHRIGTMLEREVPVREVMSAFAAADLRQRMSECLSAYEEARNHVRVDLAALAKAEGMTISELARLWGVSRQLVSRYLRQSEANS